jgi:hypothetical protein
MEIREMTLKQLEKNFPSQEGLVLLGVGGDHQEWIIGIANTLQENEIVQTTDPEEIFTDAIVLKTSGGRTDLVLLFNTDCETDMGKMAMWRLRFGDCSWVSDYKDNYSDQHNI